MAPNGRLGLPDSAGKWKIYLLNASVDDRPLSLTFLSDSRIAVSDSGNLAAALSRASSEAGHAEWNERFERLAGAPLFAVIRQDAARLDQSVEVGRIDFATEGMDVGIAEVVGHDVENVRALAVEIEADAAYTDLRAQEVLPQLLALTTFVFAEQRP